MILTVLSEVPLNEVKGVTTKEFKLPSHKQVHRIQFRKIHVM